MKKNKTVKVVVTEIKTPINNGEIREWRFKCGNKILARLYFPGAFGHSLFKVEFRVFAYEKGTLEEACNFIREHLQETEFYSPVSGRQNFAIEDKLGYSLDLLVAFEDEILQDIAI